MKQLGQIAWVTIRELLFERVFYILVAFAILSLGLSLLLGQLTYAERAKLTVDFLLAGIQLSTVLFSIFMGITILHRELNMGWVAMSLSKPISRTVFLLGKYLGLAAVQILVIVALGALTSAICLLDGIAISFSALGQALIFSGFEALILSAITFFFAVRMGAITAAISSVSIFALGHFLESANKVNPELRENTFWNIFSSIIPNLEIFNLKTLASYGLMISWDQIGLGMAYAIVCCIIFLTMACLLFEHRDIFT